MRRFDGNIVVIDLLGTYHEPGSYSFKVVLNPKRFNNGQDVVILMYDPECRTMPIDVKRWGRKLICSFVIDENVPNGVCVINIRSESMDENLHCWVIK